MYSHFWLMPLPPKLEDCIISLMNWRERFESEVRAAVGGRPIAKVAKEANLPRDAIRNILDGRDPKLSRAAEVAKALGLDFYAGPPKAAGALELARELHPGSEPWELERAIKELDRLRSKATDLVQLRERERQETANQEDLEGLRKELQTLMGGTKEPGDRSFLTLPYLTKVELADPEPRFRPVFEKWQIHESLVPSWVSPGGLMLVKAEDDSMAKKINTGDLVLVDRRQTVPIENRLYLAARQQRVVIRRIVRMGPGLGFRADALDSVDHCPKWLDSRTITLLGQVAWYGSESALECRERP